MGLLKGPIFCIALLCYNSLMEKGATDLNPTKKNKNGGNLKEKSQKLRAKLLSTYYGNPIKDMKLIAITGTTGKTTVAHFVHEILRATGEKVAVLASDAPFKTAMLHKFLSDAWKAGANYVIVTTPTDSLRDNVFYGLPVHIAAMTNYIPASLSDMTPEEYLKNEKTLFDMKPENVVLNSDDKNSDTFADIKGEKQTVSFGQQSGSNIKIINSKLYTKGTETTLAIGSDVFTVATFVVGEPAVSYMAAAAAIASVLNIPSSKITEGIANYDPEN